MPIKNLTDVLQEELRDLLSAEKQLLRALPKMAKKASAPELKEAFERNTVTAPVPARVIINK